MTDLLYLGVVGGAVHYVLYRALITRWLWSKYPPWLDKLIGCSACTGFWIGIGLGFFWRARGGALGLAAHDWALVPACGLGALVAAPVVSWAQLAALTRLGDGETPPP